MYPDERPHQGRTGGTYSRHASDTDVDSGALRRSSARSGGLATISVGALAAGGRAVGGVCPGAGHEDHAARGATAAWTAHCGLESVPLAHGAIIARSDAIG